jgi:hypothetical protein
MMGIELKELDGGQKAMRKVGIVLCSVIIVLWVLASTVPNAYATPITGFSIGRVKTVTGSLFTSVNVRDLLAVDFTFDPLSTTDRRASSAVGLYGNVDGSFSVDINGGAFAQVFDDWTRAVLQLKPSPYPDSYKFVTKEGNLILGLRFLGDGLIGSDSLDQIPDLTTLTRARGYILEKDQSGEILSHLRFGIKRPSVEIQYAESDAIPTPEPATMFLLGSGLLGLFGFARRKVRKT